MPTVKPELKGIVTQLFSIRNYLSFLLVCV